MSIYKRSDSNIWWVNFTTPSGKRIRVSTETENRREAQEFHDRLKADYWRIEKIGERPDVYFEQAALELLKSVEDQKTYDKQLQQMEYWLSCFKGRLVSSLTAEDVINNLPTHTLDKRRAQTKMSPATKNRYIAMMSKLFTLAYKRRWIVAIPDIDRYAEARVNIRWIRQEEAKLLLNNLSLSWTKDICTMALATGMRLKEILNLEWSEVDLTQSIAWVIANKSKSGFPRAVPLNADAMHVLKKWLGEGRRWVFPNPKTGSPFSDINREDFSQALLASDIYNFKFHDLRHTWASWHVQSGTPLMVLKELGGWRTIEMVQKYAHLSATHLAPFVGNVAFLNTHATLGLPQPTPLLH